MLGSFSSDWFFLIFFVNLIILAFIRTNHYEYFTRLLNSSISYGASNKLYRDTKNVKQNSGFLLMILSLLSISVVLYKAIELFVPQIIYDYGLVVFASILLVLLIIPLINKLINWFFGMLFLEGELSSEYNRNIDFFNQIAGIIVFPVSVLCIYSGIPKISIYIGLSIIISIFILRIVRLLKINFEKQIHFFYMFLYLCTVEIIPIVYLIKVLTRP